MAAQFEESMTLDIVHNAALYSTESREEYLELVFAGARHVLAKPS